MLKQIISDECRLLTFRSPSHAVSTNWPAYLAFGLFCTWLAGIARYWDNPRAELWQMLGLGSIAYVFVLATILWLLIAPLRPKNWSYRNVLTFVTLTAPPALLYAVPVERFLSPSNAEDVNGWFLIIVATWRVVLLGTFLRRVGKLAWVPMVVATVLPLAIIVMSLATLNLEHVVFNLMAGIRDTDQSANDSSYVLVRGLAYLSFLSSPVLGFAYISCVVGAWSNHLANKHRGQRIK